MPTQTYSVLPPLDVIAALQTAEEEHESSRVAALAAVEAWQATVETYREARREWEYADAPGESPVAPSPTPSTMDHFVGPFDRYTPRAIAGWIGNGYVGPTCGGTGCAEASCYLDINGRDLAGYDANGRDRSGFDRNGYDVDGYDDEGYNSYGEDRNGGVRPSEYDDDDDNGYHSDGLLSYSFKPKPIFHGVGAPWFGMEIEVTTDDVREAVNVVREHAGDLIYCKADGSVDGAELVTHPMSYEWAMESFPWAMLPDLRKRANASVISQENGIHIHIGRDGFHDPAHLYRWLKLWYRNPEPVQRIARRRASSWAAFTPTARSGQAMHAKYGKPGYNAYNDETRNVGRYQAINTTNAATLEVRVFASTLRPDHAKAALQLVASSVEYTRGLRADDVCHRAGWDWATYMAWTADTALYPELVAEDAAKRTRRFMG